MTCSDVVTPVVTTSTGRVAGRTVDGISSFLGIPYAAPPVGVAAFAAPSPATPWDGVRDATAYGPTAPQIAYQAPIAALLDNVIAPGDDYLNLNVWTPDPSAGGLPVMVWIHGGAFTRGSNRIAMYAGDTFARDGVVCVGINYRLGIAGFASLPDAPENRGLRDQIAALHWVHDNIGAFGGDPNNITIVGESAGAMSVASLLSSPAATGLFGRAIMQSGNGDAAADPADARKVTARLADILGTDPTAEMLSTIPVDQLLKAQSDVALEMTLEPNPAKWGASVIGAGMGILSVFPVIDGEVLSARPVEAIAAGAGAGIPLLAGWNADEFRLFLVPTGLAANVSADLATGMLALMGRRADALRQQIDAGVHPGDALCEALTRGAFVDPTTAVATIRPDSSTYLYEFGWESTQAGIRAGHAVEIPFVFDHLADAHSLTGPDPDQQVADEMHGAWVSFMTSGDAGWSAHGVNGEIRHFG